MPTIKSGHFLRKRERTKRKREKHTIFVILETIIDEKTNKSDFC